MGYWTDYFINEIGDDELDGIEKKLSELTGHEFNIGDYNYLSNANLIHFTLKREEDEQSLSILADIFRKQDWPDMVELIIRGEDWQYSRIISRHFDDDEDRCKYECCRHAKIEASKILDESRKLRREAELIERKYHDLKINFVQKLNSAFFKKDAGKDISFSL